MESLLKSLAADDLVKAIRRQFQALAPDLAGSLLYLDAGAGEVVHASLGVAFLRGADRFEHGQAHCWTVRIFAQIRRSGYLAKSGVYASVQDWVWCTFAG